ncbi:protein kinase domain-containing protein [Arthrobacter sp. Ld5]|uniref:serine/threonine-protein kinase n=1 Tax=Arthrobacter sp. Ld5 TaxID=649152 RepID=UPI003EBEAD93
MDGDAGRTSEGSAAGTAADRPSGGPWCADVEDGERPVADGLRVGRLLGRGGSSAVWLVTDDGGRRLALKVIAPRAAGPAEGRPAGPAAVPPHRGRHAATGTAAAGATALPSSPVAGGGTDPGVLVRELRLLQRFTHDHLLRVHGVVETDRGPGLLMDLAPGGSLLGLVTSRGPLPIPEVVTALVPVAQALGSLHAAGAVHGDVTPGNILFTAEGKPLLGDLGTARLLGAGRRGVAGTPGFLDPLHDGSFDVGADVFALAAVAWFALTGRIPGPAEQRPPLALIVPEVPWELMHLIEDALSSRRDRRPTADQFARGLLSGSTPAPLDLVPAVHASVLPDLLTRSADPPPGAPPSGWSRLIDHGSRTGRGVHGTVQGRPTPGRSTPGRRPLGERLRTAPPGPQGPTGGRADGSRARRSRRAGSSWGERFPGAGPAPASRRRAAPIPPQGADRARAGEQRTRGVLALLAGVAAVVLLVAGVALTVDAAGSAEPAVGRTPPTAPGHAPGTDPGDAPGTDPGDAQGTDPGDAQGTDPGDAQGTDPGDAQGTDPGDAQGTDPADADRAVQSGDPAIALDGLAELRAQAFVDADADLLTSVDVEGSPAMAADREAVGALAETGRTLQDLSIDIRDPVEVTDAELAGLPALAQLPAVAAPPPATKVSAVRATAVLSSYTEAASDPSSQRTGPTRTGSADQQELIFVLWTSGDGWRIHSVVTPPA